MLIKSFGNVFHASNSPHLKYGDIYMKPTKFNSEGFVAGDHHFDFNRVLRNLAGFSWLKIARFHLKHLLRTSCPSAHVCKKEACAQFTSCARAPAIVTLRLLSRILSLMSWNLSRDCSRMAVPIKKTSATFLILFRCVTKKWTSYIIIETKLPRSSSNKKICDVMGGVFFFGLKVDIFATQNFFGRSF